MIYSNKRPLEFFGQDTDFSPITRPKSYLQGGDPIGTTCPFTEKACIKITKTPPVEVIGSCMVGLPIPSERGRFEPVITCPNRFYQENIIFTDVKKALENTMKYEDSLSETKLFPELGTPRPMHRLIDWTLVLYGKKGQVLDYAAIEIQATATGSTGPIVPARNDYFSLSGKLKNSYNYGTNITMSSKTILEQVLQKVPIFQRWGKKLVLVVQDNFLRHLRNQYNFGHFENLSSTQDLWVFSYRVQKKSGGTGYLICLDEQIGLDAAQVPNIILPNPQMFESTANKQSEFTDKFLRDNYLPL